MSANISERKPKSAEDSNVIFTILLEGDSQFTFQVKDGVPSLTKGKKSPEETLPGFEVYAQLKPIVPFWQWFLAALFLGVLSLPYATYDFPLDMFGVLVLVLIILGTALLFALVYRGRSFTVGIKREGDRLLMAGQSLSENLANPSKVEFKTRTSLYVEKTATRMQLRKMVLRFDSPQDAQKVTDWLHERVGSSRSLSEMVPNYAGDVWALVYAGNYVKRSKITFEQDVCYVVDPGRNIFDVKPRQLERKDETTLLARTGFWGLGNVVMKFDSAADADGIEERLRARMKPQ